MSERGTRRTGVLAANPTLVGAVTTLVTIVAVFLAYNANQGLPFVPTYDLKMLVPDANSLVRGNEVRIGGVRVGIVRSVAPRQLPDGRVVAEAQLALDEQVRPLPVDSQVLIRPRSTLALKYVEVRPGEAEKGFEQNDTIPLSAAKPHPVELDEFFSMFDPLTRERAQGNLEGYGNALAGRGVAINEALGVAPRLLRKAEPTARMLASKRTDFEGFWRELSDLAAEVAPAAEAQAQLFVGADETFGAFAEVARPYIQETISRSPGTLDEGMRSFPEIRPFLRHSSELFAALKPGAAAAARTAPTIANALEKGAPVLARTPRLNAQLEPSADALLAFSQDPAVETGLRGLITTNRILDPTMRFLTPAQATCNYMTLLFRNVASLTSQGDGDDARWVRFIAFAPPLGPNSEGSIASAPANGGEEKEFPTRWLSIDRNYLHSNPYPYTAAPGQPRACEAGNERFRPNRRMIGNVPGRETILTEDQLPSQKRRK